MQIKYPLGIQTFSQIREDNYVYIDKTDLIHQLVCSGKVYFLSRPRRFGKSLLISTFEALFNGEKSLFEGLAITDTDYDFVTYPVVLFEFTKVITKKASDVEGYITNTINEVAEEYSIELTIKPYEQRVAELFKKLYVKTGKPVVLLVDEYDKPILDNLFKKELQAVRATLAGFYGVVKQLDKFLKFVFITGVSKFAKISVFSSMNSLTDISMEREFATLCGVTEQELENTFDKAIDKLAQYEELAKDATLAKIKHWYNGYYFHHKTESVYNPYSLLSLFRKNEFHNYWFATATPTFLIDMLQKQQYELSNLTKFEVVQEIFNACEPEHMDIQSLFLQTGYLTIKEYDAPLYKLDFPNYEVRTSFYSSVAARYGNLDHSQGLSYTTKLVQQLNSLQFDDFFETLGIFFANIPYDIQLDNEKYYQSLFFAIFKLIGLSVEAEVRTNKGRIDCVIETDDMICIIEFKLKGTKEQALQQIIDTEYEQKYLLSGKRNVLIGVEFDQDTRNLGDFVVDEKDKEH